MKREICGACRSGGGERNAVAAPFLRSVQGAVGRGDEGDAILPASGKFGNAAAEGDGGETAARQGVVPFPEFHPKLVQGGHRRLGVGLREKQGELLAAVPPDHIRLADIFPEKLGQIPENGVSFKDLKWSISTMATAIFSE